MSALPGKTALITGANAGIGKEVARQLASRTETARLYLACRNADRATAAKADLEAATGRHIFDIVVMDVADLGSVRAGLATINGSIDELVMNAGVIGPQTLDLTVDGVTTSFATNVLGHVVLLEGLLAEDRLGETALFVGSEAVRGVPKLRMKGPSFVSTSADELATVIDGSYFAGRKPDFNLAFGQAKYIGALWMGYLARHYPGRRFITVSPRQHHRHGGSQWPSPTDADSRQVRHARPGPFAQPRRGSEAARRRRHRPHPAKRRVLRQRGQQAEWSDGEPSRIRPRRGQPVVSGQRQRSDPPLCPMTARWLGVPGHGELDER